MLDSFLKLVEGLSARWNHWQSESTQAVASEWMDIEEILEPLLENLDPSLFQNTILAILAIFIPFAIVFLTDVLDSSKKRSEFERMVLSEEVLGAKKVFWLSIFGIAVLSFFSGKDVSIPEKLLAAVLTAFFVASLANSFRKTLRFAEGYKSEFEIRFLKRLRLSRLLPFTNKLKAQRMARAWASVWAEEPAQNEREHAKWFSFHIDDALETGEYALAVRLGQTYGSNLGKRDRYSIAYDLLPKVLEWNQKLSDAERVRSVRGKFGPRALAGFLKFKKSRTEHFWNWNYFSHELFPLVVEVLLGHPHGAYKLFDSLEKYFGSLEAELEKAPNKEVKKTPRDRLHELIGAFSTVFFASIESAPNKSDIWRHSFPSKWKVCSDNAKSYIARILFAEFLHWSQPRILQRKNGLDVDLTEVVNGLFPGVHHTLFTRFLILFFETDIETAIKTEPSFRIQDFFTWIGDLNDQEFEQSCLQRDQSRQDETIEIIFKYFSSFWPPLILFDEDMSEEERQNWVSYGEERRRVVRDRVRKEKLEAMLAKLNSTEIIDLCKDSEPWEKRRGQLIHLVELLLRQIP